MDLVRKSESMTMLSVSCYFFFFQAEDGIRDLVRSRGLGDVYKRQAAGRSDRQRTRHDRRGCADDLERALLRVKTEPALSLIHI